MSTLALPPTMTAQDLDDELMFQNVLLSTLDDGADDYHERREEIEENIQELQGRLDLLSASVPSSGQHVASQGAADARSTIGEFGNIGSMGNSNTNRHTTGETGYGGYGPGGMSRPSAGRKRGYPGSLSHDPYDRTPKRSTPDPALSSPPSSSLQSFDLVERPGISATERAHERHKQAEQRIRRQREDEAMARNLQQRMSNSSFGSSQAGSSSRPQVQTTIGASGHFQRPAPPPPMKAEPTTNLLPHDFRPSSYSHHGSSSVNLPGTNGQPASIKSEYKRTNPGSATQNGSLQRPQNLSMIDLTASDSEDDFSEIPPNGFTASHRAPRPTPAYNSYNGSYTMPGSYPGFDNLDNPVYAGQGMANRWTGQTSHSVPHTSHVEQPLSDLGELSMLLGGASSYTPIYGQPTSMSQLPFGSYTSAVPHTRPVGSNMPSSFDKYGTPRSNGLTQPGYPGSSSRALPSTYGLSSLLGGYGTNERPVDLGDDDEDDNDDDLWSSHRSGMYAGREDLYRNRYDAIANYDPQQTKEEINALLNNIRPDEDMPAHLRVQTPPGMAVQLHKYQELGLTWLKKCEEGSNQGGILADDMGLGKTIQMLSLIVSNRSDDPSCRQTLVVAPVALMRQWKSEIMTKIKPGPHALKVFTHHGSQKKNSFADFQQYDVVLTTFGSLASELKKMENFRLRQQHDADARPDTKREKCVFLAPEAKWYRVILDEAQCIKNKNTQTAKAARMLNARYRFCMTGTPMMNNVEELYSLIAFLRMKPYSSWEKFRLDFSLPLKSSWDVTKDNAMQKFQAVCKAIMLRRTKKSMFEGKPILILPERSTEVNNPVFSEDEKNFYDSLEGKTQLQFNKYLKTGTVGRSYSAILVLLLRLRQACCHPHLIKDFGVAATADVTPETMVELARELEDQVVARIRQKDGMFDCPVCYDATTNPAIFIPCGHDTCSDCFARITDPAMALAAGNEDGAAQAKCPECRGPVNPKRITDFHSFKKVHQREKLSPEELAAEEGAPNENDDDSDSASDSDSDEDNVDDGGDLKDFIVDDDTIEYDNDSKNSKSEKVKAEEMEETAADEENVVEVVAGPSTKPTKPKCKPNKGKAKRKPKETLAELKKAAGRSAKAKKAYLRRLRRNWVSSAKIDKTMEILTGIMDDTDEKVLIFSQWTSLLDLLEVPIDREGWGYRRYDGSMNTQARGDAVEDFTSSKKNVRIMLLSLKAGNAGLNLNQASQVIILDPFWNPYIEEQAIDRAHRIGQTREVKVHRVLMGETVEDRIIALQEKKRALISTALDEKAAQGIARLGVQELAYLFGITSNPQQRVNYVAQNAR